jgi:hypothetical protein
MANSDLLRHAIDLRESAAPRAIVEAGFRRAVELGEPVIVAVLEALNRVLLDGTGAISGGGVVRSADGALRAEWRLAWAWPAGRRARTQGGDGAQTDVIIAAWSGPTSPHGHLTGNGGGNWPLAVDHPGDLDNLRATVAAIAESSLHARIMELGWETLPAAHRR